MTEQSTPIALNRAELAALGESGQALLDDGTAVLVKAPFDPFRPFAADMVIPWKVIYRMTLAAAYATAPAKR